MQKKKKNKNKKKNKKKKQKTKRLKHYSPFSSTFSGIWNLQNMAIE